MSTLPTQAVTELQRQASEDVASVQLADFGVRALYTPAGGVSGVEVVVYVGDQGRGSRPIGQSARNAGGAGFTGLGSTHGRRLFTLIAPAVGPEESFVGGDAVGASGGIVHLQEGDTFKVPGWVAGDAESVDGVELRVGNGIERVGGHWKATVSR